MSCLKQRFNHEREIKNVLKWYVLGVKNGQAWPFFMTVMIENKTY